ncbi:MAG TPA: hypothetical protein VGR62_06205 [Candidatus Binatia bacterium]|jgi:hypothetical protein|nr:hypothetical protein [Candidatus Binatia bacterium]
MRAAVGFCLLLTFAGEAVAASPAQKCTSAKMKAAANIGAADAKCVSRASSGGVPIDEACLDKSSLKLLQAFERAEASGGCLTVDDAPQVAGILEGVVTFAEENLGDDGSNGSRRCASTRRNAAGAYLSAVLRCHAVRALAGALPMPHVSIGRS